MQNHDQQNTIVNFVNYSVVANPNTIKPFLIDKFFVAIRARVVGKFIYRVFEFICSLPI